MHEPSLVQSLSQDMRSLVEGRLTNDAFDDLYHTKYADSDDRRVREISGFCYGLYHSDTPLPRRLRGPYAVSKEDRRAIARAVLLLRSGRAYEWPDLPCPGLLGTIALFARNGGWPWLIAWLLIAGMLAVDRSFELAGQCLLLGGGTGVGMLMLGRYCQSVCLRDREQFWQAGDADVWPFLRRRDYDAARQANHLLGS